MNLGPSGELISNLHVSQGILYGSFSLSSFHICHLSKDDQARFFQAIFRLLQHQWNFFIVTQASSLILKHHCLLWKIVSLSWVSGRLCACAGYWIYQSEIIFYASVKLGGKFILPSSFPKFMPVILQLFNVHQISTFHLNSCYAFQKYLPSLMIMRRVFCCFDTMELFCLQKFQPPSRIFPDFNYAM